ncbi:DNA repair protein RecN (Recombination protein N) [Solimonas aquatica]|uniref:DNA repair protein RecN n=1 Tax=Solimonas aquatica TaxID=489703 RepID=A0A1H8ZF26_9GAMM|nr:DNA repair protein RecN [Solimonas aquatica]SEP62318.1 DNA repair protein RecN (Recombination protein N) [Solimonas aquatica]
MLKHLHIKNLAIIDELSLDFAPGFTVLTGETGAGKSILIDAIGLIIGLRADAALVRAGQEKAEISASFELARDATAKRWLAEQELLDGEDESLLLIRRVVYAEGRTRAFVNGQPVNAGALRELGEQLVEIFGQSESQTLLRSEVQRRILDDYGEHGALLDKVAAACALWQDARGELERLLSSDGSDAAQLEFLRFQISELEALGLSEHEIEELEREHRGLAHGSRLLGEGGQAQELLYGGEDCIYDRLSEAQRLLSGLLPLLDSLQPAVDAVDAAQAQTREAADALRRALDRLDLDPARLAEIESRLGAIHDLARKHRLKPAQLPEHLQSLRSRHEEAAHRDARISECQQRQQRALEAFRGAAQKLSQARRKSGERFGQAVSAIVRRLGMPHAQLVVAVEYESEATPRPHGADQLRFDFSANPGQPPRALAKVASGGELSRVSLAIQVAALAQHGVGTMIFDEVDAGISGGVAEIVGQQLRALGERRQVLSVTHLAQVAAQGHAHLAIRKQVVKQQTYTRVQALDPDARVDEIARMQGGVEISQATREHARDLLAKSRA